MNNKPNAICPVCGKSFRMCYTCEENKLESWKTVTDTLECFEVFQILHKVYVTGKMTKEDAKKKLTEFDLSEKDTYPVNILKQLNEILGETVKTTSVKEDTVNTKVEDTKTVVSKTYDKKSYTKRK